MRNDDVNVNNQLSCSTLFGAINYFTLVEGELNELRDMFVFEGGRYLMSAEFTLPETDT